MGDNIWVTNINDDMNRFDKQAEAQVWKNLSIYKVPQYMKTGDPHGAAYKPQIVSIGPYHFGEEHLKPMEEHKRRALLHLLKETEKTVSDFLNSLRDILLELKNSYEQLDSNWTDDKFLQLMVLDGCFVIEILRKNFSNYDLSDPIFSEQRQPTTIEYIKRDMLLMENQLPLLVLEKFVAIIAKATVGVQSDINSDIKSLMLKFYFPADETMTYTGEGKHMLDVVRKSMVQSPTVNIVTQEFIGTSQFGYCLMNICPVVYKSKKIANSSYHGTNSKKTISNNRSAMVLSQAGINFERESTYNLKDITFKNVSGSLHLPTITIEHNSESMFLNFIAFEQLHLEKSRFISSYFIFMYGLITSANDVGLLRDKEIIKSSISCDDTIRDIITRLAKGLSFGKDDNLCEIQQELNDYYMG
ncbi:UPF0481 protein At3g47200-like [Magnolia sinica]|uniref:UPF0481 protein At3g47200-like n=1 Tax=Magnolia sinica TaxID=86752 RepID=UPI00265805F5|nr:UPF0481 protein At3g47200-like [Magnolia sinica]